MSPAQARGRRPQSRVCTCGGRQDGGWGEQRFSRPSGSPPAKKKKKRERQKRNWAADNTKEKRNQIAGAGTGVPRRPCCGGRAVRAGAWAGRGALLSSTWEQLWPHPSRRPASDAGSAPGPPAPGSRERPPGGAQRLRRAASPSSSRQPSRVAGRGAAPGARSQSRPPSSSAGSQRGCSQRTPV